MTAEPCLFPNTQTNAGGRLQQVDCGDIDKASLAASPPHRSAVLLNEPLSYGNMRKDLCGDKSRQVSKWSKFECEAGKGEDAT